MARALFTHWALVLLLCQTQQRPGWQLPPHISGGCGKLGEAVPTLGYPEEQTPLS